MDKEKQSALMPYQIFIPEQDSINLQNCISCKAPFDFKDNPVWIDSIDEACNKSTIYICEKCKSTYICYKYVRNKGEQP